MCRSSWYRHHSDPQTAIAMAEPCGGNSSRSEGTPDGQLPAQADATKQPAADFTAQAAVATADAASVHFTEERQQVAGATQPMLESSSQRELRPSVRTRRQAAGRGLQADFVRGEEWDSDAEAEAEASTGRRAGSSNSWHPGDGDSASDASTRKRRKTEQVSSIVFLTWHILDES